MAELTEAEVVRNLANQAATPTTVKPGQRYVWVDTEGGITGDLDLSFDPPARKAGDVTVHDVASFSHYWGKHSDGGSEIFADPYHQPARITAVLDAHWPGEARWADHRLILDLMLTEQWKRWLALDGKLLAQVDFAEFLEANYADLAPEKAYPLGVRYVSAADLLEIAQFFHVNVKREVVVGNRLNNGDQTFKVDEESTATGGRDKQHEVPGQFMLAITPYDDADIVPVRARFRYREQPSGGLVFGFVLYQPEQVRLDAVDQIVGQVATAADATVMRGVPIDDTDPNNR